MTDKTFNLLLPPTKAVDLGDGTFAVATVSETAQDRGIATGGSNVTCIDTTKAWIVNHFIGDAIEVTVDGVEYHSIITANTANTITFDLIGAVVVAGDPYKIISAVGSESTIADGADVTQGAIADAAVVAGAAGTLSAKLRRLTTDLGAGIIDLAAIEIATEATQAAAEAIEAANSALPEIVTARPFGNYATLDGYNYGTPVDNDTVTMAIVEDYEFNFNRIVTIDELIGQLSVAINNDNAAKDTSIAVYICDKDAYDAAAGDAAKIAASTIVQAAYAFDNPGVAYVPRVLPFKFTPAAPLNIPSETVVIFFALATETAGDTSQAKSSSGSFVNFTVRQTV